MNTLDFQKCTKTISRLYFHRHTNPTLRYLLKRNECAFPQTYTVIFVANLFITTQNWEQSWMIHNVVTHIREKSNKRFFLVLQLHHNRQRYKYSVLSLEMTISQRNWILCHYSQYWNPQGKWILRSLKMFGEKKINALQIRPRNQDCYYCRCLTLQEAKGLKHLLEREKNPLADYIHGFFFNYCNQQ